jgi:HlyD family secretion protein
MSAAPAKTPRIIPRPQGVAIPAAPIGSSSAKPTPRPMLVEVKSAGRTEVAAIATAQAPQTEPIAQFIDLEVEARRCADLDSLRFAIVNSTRKLAQFDQALLAEPTLSGSWTITRASSVATVDRKGALIRAVEAWIEQMASQRAAALSEPRLAHLGNDARDLADNIPKQRPRTRGRNSALQPMSKTNDTVDVDFPFPHALWLPIKDRRGRILAALVALKQDNWRPQHSALMLPLADAYGHAWNALAPLSVTPVARLRRTFSKTRLSMAAAVLALLAAFLPVPMSALAPAEITAADPMLVTAPIDGVIGDILVAPGGWVEKGAPILRFVDVKLRNELEVAKRNKAVAEARHFKVMQSAVATQKDMQEIGTTKAELDVAVAELQFAEDMLARSFVRAERSGLLIYSAKSDWLGKPVTVGERLMEIGNPAHTEIKVDLPVSDAVAVQRGSTVALFLDGDPLSAVDGLVERMSYRPAVTSEQQLAFRVYAKFTDGKARRIGLRGVARVNSERVSLWFFLFRRPIAALRQRVGL